MMMWLGTDGYWVDGWSWPGILIAAVFMIMCVTMMGRMMGHHMGGRHHHDRQTDRRDDPERVLAQRLARGDIDVDEYDRLLDVVQRPRTPSRT